MERHIPDEVISAAVKKVVTEENAKDPTRLGRLESFPPTLSHEDHYRGWVLGFIFSHNLKSVVLMKKTHPDWQAGRLNGIGGKIEPGESHRAAMWREGEEETGYDYDDWQYLRPFTSSKPGLYVHVFYGVGDVENVKTLTEEEIIVCDVNTILTVNRTSQKLIGGTADLLEECIAKLENILPGTSDIK